MIITEIKKGELYLDGKPWSKWTHDDWEKWRFFTQEIIRLSQNVGEGMILLWKAGKRFF